MTSTNHTPSNSNRFNRVLMTSFAGLVAATIAFSAVATPAEAGKRERWIAGGIAAGIIGTAIVANENRRYRDRAYHRESSWERHVRRCYNSYRSYDERSDTWIDRRGRERRCRK